jgi:hypothetical protein
MLLSVSSSTVVASNTCLLPLHYTLRGSNHNTTLSPIHRTSEALATHRLHPPILASLRKNERNSCVERKGAKCYYDVIGENAVMYRERRGLERGLDYFSQDYAILIILGLIAFFRTIQF